MHSRQGLGSVCCMGTQNQGLRPVFMFCMQKPDLAGLIQASSCSCLGPPPMDFPNTLCTVALSFTERRALLTAVASPVDGLA